MEAIFIWMLLIIVVLATHPNFVVMFRKGYRQSEANYVLTILISAVVVILSPLLFIYGIIRKLKQRE